MRILILGGTGEARALAAALHGRPGLRVVSSLAGRVSNPALPVGEVRVGGFGGVDGLTEYLRRERVDVVLDTTHPFAATITRHAVAAATTVGIPLAVLCRPAWPIEPGWVRVPDVAAAANHVAGLPPGCVLLTTGRRDLAAFAGDHVHHYLIRAVEPPDGAVPQRLTVLLDRGPYTVDGETALMREHEVTALVTKNSGGDLTAAKLVAARQLGIPVVVVDRPALPPGPPVLTTVDEVLNWLKALNGVYTP